MPSRVERSHLRKTTSGYVEAIRYGATRAKEPIKLKAAGLAGETPSMIVARATMPQQRTYLTSIDELHRAPRFAAPTLLLVGDVVRLADPIALAQDAAVLAYSGQPASNLPVHSEVVTEEPLA